jgi:hypothetical protein
LVEYTHRTRKLVGAPRSSTWTAPCAMILSSIP